MTMFIRLLTLLTIAAAGFAMPMSCAQNGNVSVAAIPVIEIPVTAPIASTSVDPAHAADPQPATSSTTQRLLDRLPFECGKTAPRANDHPATFDTQPFVPGYLASALVLDKDRPQTFTLPPALIPIDSRAGPPDAPPPKSIM